MAEALDPAIPDDIEHLAQAVLEAACEQDLKLAAAESCTGGLLASLLTDIPGRSHAFERGFVVYTEDAKVEMLGVPRQTLDDHTAVSEATARAMAEGAIRHSRADLAVAITGYAEDAPEQPAGLVHFACARRDGHVRHRIERYGDIGRAGVRVAALRTALAMMREALGRA